MPIDLVVSMRLSTNVFKVKKANFQQSLLHNCSDLIKDCGAVVVVGLNCLQALEVLYRQSVLLCTQTHHLMKHRETEISHESSDETSYFSISKLQCVMYCIFQCFCLPVYTEEREDRRGSCSSDKSCSASVLYRSPLKPPEESTSPGTPLLD